MHAIELRKRRIRNAAAAHARFTFAVEDRKAVSGQFCFTLYANNKWTTAPEADTQQCLYMYIHVAFTRLTAFRATHGE